MTPNLTELAQSSADDPSPSSGGGDFEEFERFDVSGLPFTKLHPTVAFGGTAQVLRFFPEYDRDAEEYTGQGDAGLIVDDPFIAEPALGEQRVAVRDNAEKPKGDEVKIVNLDDEATKVMPGEVGVEFDSRSFYSELFDDWPGEDEIQTLLEDDDVSGTRAVVKIPGGGSAEEVIRTLDVHGRGGFGVERDQSGDLVLNDNGYPILNDGLIEYHPDWSSNTDDEDVPDPEFGPASTELRPDAEETRVVFLLQRASDVDPDYDGRGYSWTIFAELDEDRRQEIAENRAEVYNESDQTDDERTADDYLTTVETVSGDEFEAVPIQPTDEFERSEAIKRHVGTYTQWHWPDEEELTEAREEAGFDLDDFE